MQYFFLSSSLTCVQQQQLDIHERQDRSRNDYRLVYLPPDREKTQYREAILSLVSYRQVSKQVHCILQVYVYFLK